MKQCEGELVWCLWNSVENSCDAYETVWRRIVPKHVKQCGEGQLRGFWNVGGKEQKLKKVSVRLWKSVSETLASERNIDSARTRGVYLKKGMLITL